jgi:frataxin-like iron-binding protein CyaY
MNISDQKFYKGDIVICIIDHNALDIELHEEYVVLEDEEANNKLYIETKYGGLYYNKNRFIKKENLRNLTIKNFINE